MLLAHHDALIRASAISADVASERGYFSAAEPKQLERWFGPTQRKLVPGLVIPTHDVRGEVVFCQLRPDHPRVVKGKARKYEIPAGAKMAVDVPPRVQPKLRDPSVPLVITEGARKADAAVSAGLHAIDLVGVWNWRGRNAHDGLTVLADWEFIALKGRVVYLAFDSDALTNINVYKALKRLREFLAKRGTTVRVVYLPSGDGGAKVGLDDFLALGKTRDDVLAFASDHLRPPASETSPTVKVEDVPSPDTPLAGTGELLTEIAAVIDRFVVLPSRAAVLTVALYVLHTWAFEAFEATPYLVLGSPVKRSGKSTTERVLELLVRRPWRAVSTSEAALFRKIDLESPTLLLDEVDRLFSGKADRCDPIAAILNAGNAQGVKVTRIVGEGSAMQPMDFDVFCPKVLAGINAARWPDTLIDRSIVITLKRKKPTEKVERLRFRDLRTETEQLRALLARWGAEHVPTLSEARPELPEQLNDRAADAWEPLLAIADLADQEQHQRWGERARAAAVKLSGAQDDDDEHGVVALAAIKAIFSDQHAIATDTTVRALNANEELPFGAYRRGEGLDGRGLAKLLRPFGIRPRTVRAGPDPKNTPKGYRRDQFEDAWDRYLPADERQRALETLSGASEAPHPPHANNDGESRYREQPPQDHDVADARGRVSADEHRDVAHVADRDRNTVEVGGVDHDAVDAFRPEDVGWTEDELQALVDRHRHDGWPT